MFGKIITIGRNSSLICLSTGSLTPPPPLSLPFPCYFFTKQRAWNFTDVCMVGGTNLPLTIQVFVKFHDFKEVYLHKFSTKLMTFELGNFIDLKALFWVVLTDFPELVHVKSSKKPWKGLCNDTPLSIQPTHFPPILTPYRFIWFTYCTVHVEGKVCLLNCPYWKSSFM